MKVIGLTDKLRGDADKQCATGFRAWIAEAESGTWGSWEELKKQYPEASQTGDDDEVHFPLATDGTGVRALVFFPVRLVILCHIATTPLHSPALNRNPTSLLPTTQQKQATKS